MRGELATMPLPTIQSGIPIPPIDRSPKAGRRTKYPFEQMNPCESFFVPGGKLRNIASAAINWTKHNKKPWEFTCRAMIESLLDAAGEVIEKDVAGVRCWRVK